MLTPGTRLGPYEIVTAIGAGGMGEVYRAHDAKLGRDVALKVLPPETLGDDVARARLVREARLAASLNHPSICTVHDVGESEGRLFVAMELVDGAPLADLIPSEGLSLDRVLQYAMPIAEGLAVAHDRGIVHRDLKGTNVLVLPDGRVKILDFGLAARQSRAVEETRSMSGVEPGVVAGTLAYMSPEALRGEGADVRSDVWSFGVLLQEMASGHRPFEATSGADLTSHILRDAPARMPSTVHPGLAAIVERCLSKDPVRRFAHAGEVRAALETVRAGGTELAQSTIRPGRGVVLGLVAAAVVVIGLGLAMTGWFRRAPDSAVSSFTIRSLAVLPLENLSGDPSQDYFADGLTEELIGRLSGLSGLAVTSRTSVMQFKRSQRPITEIGKQLGVQAMVEGTVSRVGDQVRVTARLVDAVSERSLWEERYERSTKDVLAIQAEIASAIGDAIRTSITPQERRRLAAAPATDSQAYDLYLKGRFHQERESPTDNREAIDFFERAVAADPQFAAAYAELGRAYNQRLFYYAPGETSLQQKAFVAIQHALAIDPNLDTAYLAQGLALWQPANRFPHDQAIASYRKAIQLNPSSDEAHHQLGLVYLHIGLLDDALREIHEAMRLNPANMLARFREGVVFHYQTRYAEAVDVFARTPSEIQPALVSFALADAQFHLGRKDDARRTIADYLRDHSDDPGALNTSMEALFAGDARDMDRLADLVKAAREKKGFGHFHHAAFTIARAYALAGQAQEAVSWLRQAADDGYPCYPVFAKDSTLDRIRADRGFQEFLAAEQARWEGFKKLAR